jgi:hypothetical protein
MTLSQTAWATKSTDSSAKGNPPGNNGTIKVNGATLQDGPRNEPHVGCVFNLTFSGYDQGDLQATVHFGLQAPTLRSSGDQTLLDDVVPIGGDPASGANDLDASRQYTLDFTGVTPHAKQGFHVKVTIHADGSKGSDVKHKVFWVSPCAESAPTTTTTTGNTPTTVQETTSTTGVTTTTVAPGLTTTTLAPTTTTTQAPKVEGIKQETTTTTITTAAPTTVLGEVLTKPAAPLPRTGSRSADLAFLGGLALALGATLTLMSEAAKGRLARQVA